MKGFSIGFMLLLSSVAVSSATEESAVEAVFVGYMSAATSHDGSAVAAAMSADTVRWWTAVIRKSSTARKEELMALPLYEAQSILFMRLRLSPKERRDWDGRIYFEKSYSKGWNSSQALQRIRDAFPECVKSWKITQNEAFLSLTDKGQPVRGGFRFVKEQGVWKIDGLDQTRQVEERSNEALKLSGLSKEQFIEQMVARMTGGKFPPELWNPEEE
jgi:hypothetical protein